MDPLLNINAFSSSNNFPTQTSTFFGNFHFFSTDVSKNDLSKIILNTLGFIRNNMFGKFLANFN